MDDVRTVLTAEIETGLAKLAQGCRIIAMEGHEDMAQGHLSWRDPGGLGFWFKRTGIGLSEVMGPEDFVLCSFAGKQLAGKGGMHGEWPIHGEILRRRADADAVGHTHPLHASVFSATREKLKAVAHEGSLFWRGVPYYTETSDLVLTAAQGRDVARDLGGARAVLLRNHGISYVGGSIEECALVGIWLEKACQAQLLARASGIPFTTPDEKELEQKERTVFTPGYLGWSWNYYARKLARFEAK